MGVVVGECTEGVDGITVGIKSGCCYKGIRTVQ